jgi:hypothetical protein
MSKRSLVASFMLTIYASALHVLGEFSTLPGTLRGLQVVPESESFTPDEIAIEG